MKKTFWKIVIIINFLLIIVEYIWFSKYSTTIGGLEWNWGWALFFTQLLYHLLSFQIVGPTELGAKLFFGKPISEVSSGLVFVPLGVCQLKTETRLTVQDEIPGPPERIWREPKGKEGGEVPIGYFPPIRIPFGFPKTKDELINLDVLFPDGKKQKLDVSPDDDPLNIRITAEVVPVIRWRIVDYIQFLTTIGSKEEARKQLEDCAVGSLIREFAKISPAIALANLGTYSFNLGREIEERIKGWGIELASVQIKMIHFHRDLNEAIGKVPEAKLEAKTRVLLGEGEGAAEKAVLDGRTKGIRKMMELGISPDLVIKTETARKIAETSIGEKKVIIAGSGGFADLMAVGSALGIGEVPEKEKEGKDKR